MAALEVLTAQPTIYLAVEGAQVLLEVAQRVLPAEMAVMEPLLLLLELPLLMPVAAAAEHLLVDLQRERVEQVVGVMVALLEPIERQEQPTQAVAAVDMAKEVKLAQQAALES